MQGTPSVSQRARKRATQSRLRALIVRKKDGTHYYNVHNLTSGSKYIVSIQNGTWTCHCEGAKGQRRCKHLQRVLDREEKRIRAEALNDG